MKYRIEGEPMPVVICELDEGETMFTESGSMVWMSPNLEMKTVGGGVGKIFGRILNGENLFQNTYTARGSAGEIAFASSFPGSLLAVEITPERPVIVQKRAFLAATEGVELSTFFQKKLAVGFFGGEGFLMQKLSGRGIAFLELDGHAVSYSLAPGEELLVDPGNVAMMDSTCSVDVRTVKGAKNVLFGGEGLFLTALTGPGRVTLQTMSMQAFARELSVCLPRPSGKD